MKNEIIEELKNFYIFKNLSNEELQQVADEATEHDLKKGDMLFWEGDEATHFFAIVSGTVNIFKTSNDGQEQIIHILSDKQFIAEAAIFGLMQYPANAVASKSTRVIKIPKIFFRNYILHHADVSLKIMAGYSERMRDYLMTIEYLRTGDIHDRIMKFFRRNCTSTEQGLCVRKIMTKRNLAALLGITPECLSRNLRTLKQENLIVETHDYFLLTTTSNQDY